MVQLYTLKDDKVQSFGAIFMARTHGEAVRMLSDDLESKVNQLSKHPEDFSLYHIGAYDEITGKLEQAKITHVIGAASCMLPKEEKNNG